MEVEDDGNSQISQLNINALSTALGTTENYHKIVKMYSEKIASYNRKLYIFDTFIDFDIFNFMSEIKGMRVDRNKSVAAQLKLMKGVTDEIQFKDLKNTTLLGLSIFNVLFKNLITENTDAPNKQLDIYEKFIFMSLIILNNTNDKDNTYNGKDLDLTEDISTFQKSVMLFARSRNGQIWTEVVIKLLFSNLLLNTLNFIDIHTDDEAYIAKFRQRMKTMLINIINIYHQNMIVLNHSTVKFSNEQKQHIVLNFKVITTLFYLFSKYCYMKNCYHGLSSLIFSNFFNKISYLHVYGDDGVNILINDLLKANLILSSRFLKLPLSFSPLLFNPLIAAYDKAFPPSPFTPDTIKNAEAMSLHFYNNNKMSCFENSNLYLSTVTNLLKIAYPDDYIDFHTQTNSSNTNVSYTLENKNTLVEFRGAHIFLFDHFKREYGYLYINNRIMFVYKINSDNDFDDAVNTYRNFFDNIETFNIIHQQQNNSDSIYYLVFLCILNLRYCKNYGQDWSVDDVNNVLNYLRVNIENFSSCILAYTRKNIIQRLSSNCDN